MRPPRIALSALLASALVAVGGCSTLHVTTDWDRTVDFAAYRTYRWAPTKKTDDVRRGDGSLLDARIRRAVGAELSARGFSAAEKREKADLLLVYRLSARNRVDVYRHAPYRGPYGRVVDVRQYREGTLVLMFVDPELDQVIWEGAGVGAMSRHDAAEHVAEVVAKILEEFPPR